MWSARSSHTSFNENPMFRPLQDLCRNNRQQENVIFEETVSGRMRMRQWHPLWRRVAGEAPCSTQRVDGAVLPSLLPAWPGLACTDWHVCGVMFVFHAATPVMLAQQIQICAWIFANPSNSASIAPKHCVGIASRWLATRTFSVTCRHMLSPGF